MLDLLIALCAGLTGTTLYLYFIVGRLQARIEHLAGIAFEAQAALSRMRDDAAGASILRGLNEALDRERAATDAV